jgi:hypothetical protein
MSEVASKAATEVSTVGLLKVRGDIASQRTATPPLIAGGGYRVRSRRPRRDRGGAPLADKPMPVRWPLTALFAGGALSLAVLAGPLTCPTCNPVHADGQLNVERIAAPISTAAISLAPDHTLDRAPAAVADEATAGTGKLPDTTQELTDRGPPQVEIAAATVGSPPEPPLPPVANTTLTSKNITAVEPEGPALRAGASHRHVSIKRRRANARIQTNEYNQAPGWAAKMFETNWQAKAFAYQYETHSLPKSARDRRLRSSRV